MGMRNLLFVLIAPLILSLAIILPLAPVSFPYIAWLCGLRGDEWVLTFGLLGFVAMNLTLWKVGSGPGGGCGGGP